ncbi:hypothetical protein [Deinococcus sonorensis]|uniref:Copper amine oxidase-like N-terminal domain-containing protein n=2 Tax=Deinococcus sonorensis TaxID=309891 RepID=A0AAU7UAB1_9DEIO
MLTRIALTFSMLVASGLPLASAQTATPSTPAARTVTAASGEVSALAVEISGAVKGRLIDCPAQLKLSTGSVCLYSQNVLPALRTLIRSKVATRAVGAWKTDPADKASSLLLRTGNATISVLLARLSAQETLVILSPLQTQTQAAATRPAMPAGIVKGEPYVLDTDLKGLVTVANLGSGSYRLTSGSTVLTLSSGKRTATLGSGTVELANPAVSDGRNLLIPLNSLRSLGCTLTTAQAGVAVSCGTASATIRPIVF